MGDSPRDQASEAFDAVARGLLDTDRGVDRARIMYSSGLRCAGKFFAFQRHDDLVVKLPAERVSELLAMGVGRPFDAGRGRPMKQWVRIGIDNVATWAAFAAEARDFIAGRGASAT